MAQRSGQRESDRATGVGSVRIVEMHLLADPSAPNAWTLWTWDDGPARRMWNVASFADACSRARRAAATLVLTEDVWLEMTALGQTPPMPPSYVVLA